MFQPVLRYQLTFESPGWPSAVSFLDSSRRLVAGNQEGELYAWDLPETPPPLPEQKPGNKKREAPNVPPAWRLDGHSNAVSHLQYLPGRKLLVSSSYDRSVRLWNLEQTPTGRADVVLDRLTREAEFKRTKKDEVLQQPGVSVQTLPAAHVLEGHEDWILALAVSPDGNRLLTGDASSRLVLWDLEQRVPVAKWSGYPWNWIVAAAFSADGQSLLVSEYRYKRDDFDIPAAALRVLSVADGAAVLDVLKVQFPKHDPTQHTYGSAQTWNKFVGAGLVAVAASPDGKYFAAGQGGEIEKGQVHLLDRATGQLVRDVSGHQSGVTDIAFSRDSRFLFTTGRDTTVRIISVEDGKEIAALGAPRGGQFKDWISAIALSPDERFLAAADIEGHVAVWELVPAPSTVVPS